MDKDESAQADDEIMKDLDADDQAENVVGGMYKMPGGFDPDVGSHLA